MKQTIEIEVPDGYKAVYYKETRKVEMVRIEPPDPELPKTWEEFCKNNPVKNNECFIFEGKVNKVSTGWERETKHKDILPSEETAEAFLALMQLIQLRDCYRQGWKPDWISGDYKHTLSYGRHGLIEDYTYSDNRILTFQSSSICYEFMENFRDLIEKAKELI